MTRDEFKILVKAMKAVYAQQTFLPDQDAFNVWYGMLKDLPYDLAQIAIQKHMLTEKFPPTIADIRSHASGIVQPEEEMSELEAWARVYKAICNSAYHAEREFEKLPRTCQIAVGAPANLREWATMDSEKVVTVEQSHFIRNYRAAVQRCKDEAKLPAGMRQLIEETQKKHMQLESRKEPVLRLDNKKEAPKHEGVPMPDHVKRKIEEMRERMNRKGDE